MFEYEETTTEINKNNKKNIKNNYLSETDRIVYQMCLDSEMLGLIGNRDLLSEFLQESINQDNGKKTFPLIKKDPKPPFTYNHFWCFILCQYLPWIGIHAPNV